MISGVMLKMNKYPNLVFRLGRRAVSSRDHAWLFQKKEYFSRMWERDGRKLLKQIEKVCGIRFPRRIVDEGIDVYLYKRRRYDGDYLGDMIETNPRRINLYLGRKSTWRSVRAVVVHELIHCLMWQAYYYDLKRREVSLFEDYFADELLTSLVEHVALRRSLGRIDYHGALNYAISEVRQRIIGLRKRKKEHRKMVKSLKEFMKEYQRRVRRGESDILKERRRLLLDLPSPLPPTLDNY
jgi:uncharacterized protein YjaZ